MGKLHGFKKNLNRFKVARAMGIAENNKKLGLTPYSNRRSNRPQQTVTPEPNTVEITVDNRVVTDVKYSKE